jgi:hypothetical protein
LAPDLHAGLRRLKLAAMRALAPELLVTAKTQRWAPEELLRTLVEAEICARDASNARHRLKAAAFPVAKTLEEFDVAASSIPRATFDYLASLEWITARENLCLVGPAGTGKSHTLIALGVAAVQAGHRVRYFTAAELVETASPSSTRPAATASRSARGSGRPAASSTPPPSSAPTPGSPTSRPIRPRPRRSARPSPSRTANCSCCDPPGKHDIAAGLGLDLAGPRPANPLMMIARHRSRSS